MLHFHKEGAVSIVLASLVTVAIIFAADHFLKEHYWVMKGVQVLALLLLIIILQFFWVIMILYFIIVIFFT